MADEISRSNTKWNVLFKAKDFNAIGELYTADCKLYISGIPLMEGREGVVRAAQGASKAGGHHASKETDELIQSGDMLVERGRYTMFKDDDSIMDQGKFVQIFKKDDGEWKIYIDCPSSDTPRK